MHFLFSSDGEQRDKIEHACTSMFGAGHPVLSGPRGVLCLISLGSNECASLNEGSIAGFVSGDPMAKFQGVAMGRDELILKLLSGPTDLGDIDIHHPSVVGRVDVDSGEYWFMSDSLGGSPVFEAVTDGVTFFSSSPDLLALVINPELDLASCWELRTQGRVTFPHTLYDGILQIDPRSAVKAGCRVIRKSKDYRRKTKQKSMDLGEARIQIRSLAARFFNRIAKLEGGKLITLSAGVDSRFTLEEALSSGVNPITSATLAPEANLQTDTARSVAEVAKIEHRVEVWSMEKFFDRYLTTLGLLVPSHLLWEHSHFLGHRFTHEPRAVLGGYLADTLLAAGGMGWLARKRIKPGFLRWIPSWAINGNSKSVPPQVQRVLSMRMKSVQRTQPGWVRDTPDLYLSWPLSRAVAAAHFLCQYHQWAHYEFFMTSGMPSLINCLGPERMRRGLKAQLLEPLDKVLTEVPVNPQGGSNWLSYRKICKEHKQEFGVAVEHLEGEAREHLSKSATRSVEPTLYPSADVQISWALRCSQGNLGPLRKAPL